MNRLIRACVLAPVFTLALGVLPVLAQEPAKDNPSVPRFPGMAMDSGQETDFNGFDFLISADGQVKRVEGKSWEFSYYLKEGARHASPLEIVRNYASQFNARGGRVVYQTSDASEATMMMPLGAGERWMHLIINNGGEQMMMSIIETAAMKQKVEFSADEMAAQMASTGTVTLHGVLFDTGKTDIKPESDAVLDEISTMMANNPDLKFRIEGHTDNVGVTATNLTLSRGRAAAVKAALVSRSVAAERLTSEGFGDAKPIGDNATEEGRRQNRRVELVKG
jgi:OmpA-OmpF porin, OOP family